MTETILFLLSLLFGITTANVFGKIKPKYTMGLTGNAIIGVFGSVLFLKVLSRIPFYTSIVPLDIISLKVFLNLAVSAIGSILLLYFIKKLTA